VLLVDDHPLLRQGVAQVLNDADDLEVVGEEASAEAAFRSIDRVAPDIVVIDVELPGMDGVDACASMLHSHARLKVVILTRHTNEGVMLRALAAGAKGFLVKESDPDRLRHAVRTVADGGTYVDPQVTGKLVLLATKGRRARGPFGLTVQEMRVIELLPGGLTNAEIATELCLSVNTVKTHLRRAMSKMQVHDRTEAAVLAQREGIA
jgi:DNA-binding NarL/FixJ family response regulator